MSIDAQELTLHHVGVAVSDLEQGRRCMADLFGFKTISGPFFDEIQDVTVEFVGGGTDRNGLIELVAPGSANSPLSTVLKKGIGAYHVCYEVSDLEKAVAESRRQKCILLGAPVPAVAFQGRHIAWLYTPMRCLIELLQKE